MSVVTEKHILNIRPGMTAPLVVHCSQGDTGLALSFALYDGIEPYDPTGATISAHGVRADNAGWGPISGTVEAGKVVIELPEAATAVSGPGVAELTIGLDGAAVGTANFALMVEEATFPQGVTYDDDLSVYQSILNYVQGLSADISEQVLQSVDDRLDAQDQEITELRAAVGTPLVTETAAGMTDTDKIYVYVGSEDGYTYGNWYYYDGSDWVSGGVYNSLALVTDTTLSIAGDAADAKATGDAVDDVNSAISLANSGYEYINTTFAHGVISTSSGTAGEVTLAEAYKYQAVTPDAVSYNRDVVLSVNSGYQYLLFWYDSSDAYTGRTGAWQKGQFNIPSGQKFRIFIALDPADTSANVSADVFARNIVASSNMGGRVSAVVDEEVFINRKISASNSGGELIETTFMHGTISTSTGHVGEVTTTTTQYLYQAVTPEAFSYSKAKTLRCNAGYAAQVWWYDENDAYVSRSGSFVSEYNLVANRRYRLFIRFDPHSTSANMDLVAAQNNVFIVTEIGERLDAIEDSPLTTLPGYILNTLSYKQIGPLSRGYILLSCDDGTEGLATYTIPMLAQKEVPCTFGLLSTSAVITNETYLETLLGAVEDGCCVAMHGSTQWPTLSESALSAYFDATEAVFTAAGITEVCGAICPGGAGDDTSTLVQAVAGGRYGAVFSGGAHGEVTYGSNNASGPRTNMYAMNRKSAIAWANAAAYQAAIDDAYENHYILCPFWHDYTIVDSAAYKTIIEGMIDYAKTKGLTFITMKDLPSIT